MLRPDLFGALASHAGDALYELCYWLSLGSWCATCVTTTGTSGAAAGNPLGDVGVGACLVRIWPTFREPLVSGVSRMITEGAWAARGRGSTSMLIPRSMCSRCTHTSAQPSISRKVRQNQNSRAVDRQPDRSAGQQNGMVRRCCRR
jgi:hypothetical protein